MNQDLLGLLFIVLLVIMVFADPPGPGTPRRIRVLS
jgi:hypothetical protein